jgi:Methyltransferase domain
MLYSSPASASSVPIGVRQKSRELTHIFLIRLGSMLDRSAAEGAVADVESYERLVMTHAGRPIKGARVLEVGYGARPLRLLAMLAFGADITGIDLDTPMIQGRPGEIVEMWRTNGAERVLKSVVRFALFDLIERRYLAQALQKRGFKLSIDRGRLLVGDAADLELERRSLDLVYSEDCFEHMREDSIRRLLARLAVALAPDGLCLIRPNIFTGITGGHLTDWLTPEQVRTRGARQAEPWEHLRKRRFMSTGYLNELPRARYRQLFGEHFQIIEERVRYLELGREYLTPEVKSELAEYNEDELFSNQVLFVLKAH